MGLETLKWGFPEYRDIQKDLRVISQMREFQV
jgi:hypothetical protein